MHADKYVVIADVASSTLKQTTCGVGNGGGALLLFDKKKLDRKDLERNAAIKTKIEKPT